MAAEKMIYLDNSATTPLSAAAKEKMLEAFDSFGNPSSLHSEGLAAQKLISSAREVLFSALLVKNPNAYSLIFTSSGSEANNQIIFSALSAKSFRFTPRIVTTDSEHPSVLEPISVLEKRGVEVIRLSTKGGAVNLDKLRSAINERTVLLSVMTVNNETGAIYDLKKIFSLAKRINPSVITHTDCVQGFMKIPFSPSALSADAVTISSHKIHGPKGVGALLLSNGLITSKRVAPLIYGGGQEKGLRSGTENTLGIVGFSAAAEEAARLLPAFEEKAARLRSVFLSALSSEVSVNIPEKYAPHIISITLPSIRSETMLHFLSAEGVFVSSGSACSSNKKASNYVLPAFGLSEKETDFTLRVSLSYQNTEEEMLIAAEKINLGIKTLIRRN